MLLSSLIPSVTLATILFSSSSLAANEGEEARWLVQSSTWATLSWMEDGDVSSMVVSHAESNGRIFINLPIGDIKIWQKEVAAAMTFSEAQIDPTQFEGAKCGLDGSLDPEDPRCAKLTISGVFSPVTEETEKEVGRNALYATHPVMKDWPEGDHGFAILELTVSDVWMIANFGGGGAISPDLYFAADPMHHPVQGFGDRRTSATVKRRLERPTFTSPAAHARWLVSNSLWTTVSTNGSKRMGVENQAWGNIRSMHDGECLFSSVGLPVFYLPTPDPTNVDVQANSAVCLSFTEASLPELVGADGSICNGADPEDPICAKLSLHGSARPLTDNELEYAMKAFGSTHPRGSWLSSGGGHTGGQYYTIDLHSLQFLENYGGFSDLSVEDYLSWAPDSSDNLGADQINCDARSAGGESHEHSGMEGGEHGHGGMGGEDGNGGHGGEQQGRMGEHPHDVTDPQNVKQSKSDFNFSSFAIGTVFGFMFWGPTMVMFVYFKFYNGHSAVGTPENYAAVVPTTTTHQAEVV